MSGEILLVTAAGYLIGAIPVGVLIGRLFGFDPRTRGSGNVGMTNVARIAGRLPAALTFMGDVLKGMVPVLIARRLGFGPTGLGMVGMAAFLGAIWSVFLGFSGGRGVSAALGVWLALAPTPVLLALAVFIIVFVARKIVSLASLSAAVALPVVTLMISSARPYLWLALAMAALVFIRHRENIARLLAGEEKPLRLGGA